MAESNIEWTENTWNVTTGCSYVSKECDECYAKTQTAIHEHNPTYNKYSKGFNVIVEHEDTLTEPLTWKTPKTVFVNSMSDLFHKDVSLDFIQKVFQVMNETQQHTYQVLTKRDAVLDKYSSDLEWGENIWMGVSVGTQKATSRIKALQNCGAKHKFLSIEPFIEEITDINLDGINLVIVGGESGSNNARPLEESWVLRIKDFCDKANVPFFFKQWGKERNNPNPNDPTLDKDHRFHAKGGCMLNGKLYKNNPTIESYQTPTVSLYGEDYYIMDTFNDLNTIWELKSYLPRMEETLYYQLKEDIRKNGINDPILYISTQDNTKLVIEGHTRLSAAIDLRLKIVPYKEITEPFESLDDIKLWMIKHQFQRRNLSNVEKIQLAFLSKVTIEKMAKNNLSKGGKNIYVNVPIDTNAEIAKIAGVGRTTVTRYTSVIEKASKLTLQQMNKGEISIYTAYNAVKNQPEKTDKKVVTNKPKIETNLLESIEQGKNQMKSGEIGGIVILKNAIQLDMFTEKQKSAFGFYLLNK